MSNWQVVLLEPAKTVLSQVGQFLAKTLWVFVILLVGWLIARVIKEIVTKGLRLVKVVDYLAEQISLDNILEKGGIRYSLSELIGIISYWLVLLITAVMILNVIGAPVAADLFNRIILYVPNVIVTIFILILGMFVATLLNNIVNTAANNAGLSQGKLLGKIVEAVVMIFAVAITLEQLRIGSETTKLIISIILASLGLGAALAFGLGCKDVAGKTVSDLIEKLKRK